MKRLLLNSGIVLASVLAALALGEAALRVIGFSFPSWTAPDELTGSRLRPNIEGWAREEGVAHVKINSQGLRDREHPIAKAPGTARIAVLGDSFTFAVNVPVEAAYWSVLERELKTCGKPVEVINFGVDGYGTAQELLLLRHRVWRYSPDMVLLAFFPGNDVRNNSKALEPEKMRPFFVLRDGELVLDGSFAQDAEFRQVMRAEAQRAALQGLRVYQLLRRVKAGRFEVDYKLRREAGLDDNIFREPPNPAWTDAWNVTDQLLAAMHAETREHGARFTVMVVSNPAAVYPDPAWRAQYAKKLGVNDLFYPERRLQQAGERHGFEVLALAPELQRRADAERKYLHGFSNTVLGFGHWNENGHELAGKLIAQQLCARG